MSTESRRRILIVAALTDHGGDDQRTETAPSMYCHRIALCTVIFACRFDWKSIDVNVMEMKQKETEKIRERYNTQKG